MSLKLYIDITRSIYFPLSALVLLISLIQSVNGPQFLNITPLIFSSNRLAASLSAVA